MTVTSLSFSSSSRARFQPTLPAPATMTYMARPVRRAIVAERRLLELVDRDRVGQIVCRPCSAYQAARRGSSTRAITFGTSKRRCASCETTRLVLSPFVEAMKTSASAMPASVSASISSAVPIVNRPAGLLPGLAELDVQALVGERVLVEDGDGVPGTQGGGGDGGADAAGADDEHEHCGATLRRAAAGPAAAGWPTGSPLGRLAGPRASGVRHASPRRRGEDHAAAAPC